MILDQLKEKEFSILLFTSQGCKFCEDAKPNFKEASESNENIKFLEVDFIDQNAYYLQFCEKNEDGTPKIAVPCFYVHHRDAITEENPYGFIGGWEGASKEDLAAVCHMINNFSKEHEQIQASV